VAKTHCRRSEVVVVSTDSAVVEQTRTEINVETEEITETRFRCRNCEQLHEEEDVLTVRVDVDRDGEGVCERIICHDCAELVFEYDDPDPARSYLAEQFVRETIGNARLKGLIGPLVRLLVPAAVAIFVMSQVLQAVTEAVSSNPEAFEEAARESGGLVFPTLLETAGAILPLFILIVLIMMAASVGPRGM
jgi:hypothetical protein